MGLPWILFAAVLLVLIPFSWYWRRQALKGVSLEASFAKTHAFPGEEVELCYRARNRKWLPVPWLFSKDVIPKDLHVAGARLARHHLQGWQELRHTWPLGSYETLERCYRAIPLRRGRMVLREVELSLSHPFLAETASKKEEAVASLIVYPRALDLPAEMAAAADPAGIREKQRWLFPDPLRVVGIRPYEPGDPMRFIHWPATARTGELQVRKITSAIQPSTVMFLEARTRPDQWYETDPDRLEPAIAVAAGLVRRFLLEGEAVGLVSNGSVYQGPRHIRVGPGRGSRHWQRLYESLALISGYSLTSLPALMRQESRKLGPESRWIVVTPVLYPALLAEVHRAARDRWVLLITVGGESPQVKGIRHLHVPAHLIEEWQEAAPRVQR